MPLQEDYQFTLDAFHGPLDLLLFLIRRTEVDIQDIPIAQITDQYVGFLRELDDIDVDQAGEFLVMAATLIEIKSRTIMPPETSEDGLADGDGDSLGGDSIDPRSELVRQLLAYQRYRTAMELLQQRRSDFDQRWPRRPGRVETDLDNENQPEELELEDAHVWDLYEVYERIMSSIDFSRMGDHLVEIDDTPIALHEEDLLDRLRHASNNRISLLDSFQGKNTGQRIGLFLATLELVRLRKVVVRQDAIEDEIVIDLNDDPDPNASEN